jgi:hypothetical protein
MTTFIGYGWRKVMHLHCRVNAATVRAWLLNSNRPQRSVLEPCGESTVALSDVRERGLQHFIAAQILMECLARDHVGASGNTEPKQWNRSLDGTILAFTLRQLRVDGQI